MPKSRVVCIDMMCFDVDSETLEPLTCSFYDPYAWVDQKEGYVETIDISEFQNRRNKQFMGQRRGWTRKTAYRG